MNELLDCITMLPCVLSSPLHVPAAMRAGMKRPRKLVSTTARRGGARTPSTAWSVTCTTLSAGTHTTRCAQRAPAYTPAAMASWQAESVPVGLSALLCTRVARHTHVREVHCLFVCQVCIRLPRCTIEPGTHLANTTSKSPSTQINSGRH